MEPGHQAYLLAAGKGTRAGGPKAWLESSGKTMLERQLGFLLSLFPPEDVAVSIQEPWLERCTGLAPAVRWTPVDPSLSPLASLQALLREHPLRGWGYMHHVDMPVWEPGLFELLASRLPAGDSLDAVLCSHDGRRGHPVVLSAGAAPKILALDPSGGRLDRWLAGARTLTVETGFACVRENWNTGAP